MTNRVPAHLSILRVDASPITESDQQPPKGLRSILVPFPSQPQCIGAGVSIVILTLGDPSLQCISRSFGEAYVPVVGVLR